MIKQSQNNLHIKKFILINDLIYKRMILIRFIFFEIWKVYLFHN